MLFAKRYLKLNLYNSYATSNLMEEDHILAGFYQNAIFKARTSTSLFSKLETAFCNLH